MRVQTSKLYTQLFYVGRRLLPQPNLEGARYPYNLISDPRTVTITLITWRLEVQGKQGLFTLCLTLYTGLMLWVRFLKVLSTN